MSAAQTLVALRPRRGRSRSPFIAGLENPEGPPTPGSHESTPRLEVLESNVASTPGKETKELVFLDAAGTSNFEMTSTKSGHVHHLRARPQTSKTDGTKGTEMTRLRGMRGPGRVERSARSRASFTGSDRPAVSVGSSMPAKSKEPHKLVAELFSASRMELAQLWNPFGHGWAARKRLEKQLRRLAEELREEVGKREEAEKELASLLWGFASQEKGHFDPDMCGEVKDWCVEGENGCSEEADKQKAFDASCIWITGENGDSKGENSSQNGKAGPANQAKSSADPTPQEQFAKALNEAAAEAAMIDLKEKEGAEMEAALSMRRLSVRLAQAELVEATRERDDAVEQLRMLQMDFLPSVTETNGLYLESVPDQRIWGESLSGRTAGEHDQLAAKDPMSTEVGKPEGESLDGTDEVVFEDASLSLGDVEGQAAEVDSRREEAPKEDNTAASPMTSGEVQAASALEKAQQQEEKLGDVLLAKKVPSKKKLRRRKNGGAPQTGNSENPPVADPEKSTEEGTKDEGSDVLDLEQQLSVVTTQLAEKERQLADEAAERKEVEQKLLTAKDMIQKDRQLLVQAALKRDKGLKEAAEQLERREKQLAEAAAQLKKRDAQLAEGSAQLAERERRVQELTVQLREVEEEIENKAAAAYTLIESFKLERAGLEREAEEERAKRRNAEHALEHEAHRAARAEAALLEATRELQELREKVAGTESEKDEPRTTAETKQPSSEQSGQLAEKDDSPAPSVVQSPKRTSVSKSARTSVTGSTAGNATLVSPRSSRKVSFGRSVVSSPEAKSNEESIRHSGPETARSPNAKRAESKRRTKENRLGTSPSGDS